MNWERDGYRISDDPGEIDEAAVLRLLDGTYWAGNRPHERTRQALRRSLGFSVFRGAECVGFGRVLTDGAVYAVLLDVVIDPAHQRRGLGRWLVEVMRTHPEIAGLRVVLWSTDQERFYQACGFHWEREFLLFGIAPIWAKKDA